MISWADLKLGDVAQLRFPDGKIGAVRFQQQSLPLQNRQKEAALIAIAEDGNLELIDSVDTSPNYDEPWMLVVSGNHPEQLFLFGGEVGYVISSDGRVIRAIPTFRQRRNAEFWRTDVVRLDDEAILIVYEVGVLVVDSTLEVRWHVEKALIDFFDRRDGASLVFLRDHETPFPIDLRNGSGVPPIETV